MNTHHRVGTGGISPLGVLNSLTSNPLYATGITSILAAPRRR